MLLTSQMVMLSLLKHPPNISYIQILDPLYHHGILHCKPLMLFLLMLFKSSFRNPRFQTIGFIHAISWCLQRHTSQDRLNILHNDIVSLLYTFYQQWLCIS